MSSRLPIIRITKQFHFEMAHALSEHDGPCKNIHGHSYYLSVTVSGKPSQEMGSSSNGMVIDFTSIKSIVQEHVIAELDHTLALNETDKNRFPDLCNHDKVLYLPFPPTCEMLLVHIVNKLTKHLPGEIKLQTIQLNETNTSYAEWHAEENL